MAIDAQDLERFAYRKVVMYAPIHGEMRGKLVPPDPGTSLVLFYEEVGGHGATTALRYISHTSVEAIFDCDPLWNDCPKCEVAAGSRCVAKTERTREISVCHMERYAHSHLREYQKRRDAEIEERQRKAAAPRSTDMNTHTAALFALPLPATAGGPPDDGAPF